MPASPEILLIAISNIDLPAAKDELHFIRDTSLKNAKTKNFITIRENSGLNFNSLANAIINKEDFSRITMLHYCGHSSNEGIYVQEAGNKKIVGLESLKTLIETHQRFRFVFLNSCYSDDIAREFIECGVPIVIGTTSAVRDSDAAKVAAMFYEFLGATPITIQDAYRLTNDYFVNNPEELTAKGDFRTFDIETPDKDKNKWRIYIKADIEKLIKSQRDTLNTQQIKRLENTIEWKLIPDNILVLSKEENEEYQQKVLCLYNREQEAIFKGFKSKFNMTGGTRWIIHGVWDIFREGQFNNEAFKKEWDAATIIIHFIDGNDYLNQPFFTDGDFSTKANAWLPIHNVEVNHFNKNSNWFEKSTHIKPVVYGLGENIGAVNDKRVFPTYELLFDIYAKPVEQFLDNISIDEDLLAEDMKKVPFRSEMKTFRNAKKLKEQAHIYFTLIQGTSLCAQRLIVQKLRNHLKIDKNIKTLRITFNIKTGPKSSLAFWKELYRLCELKTVVFNDDEYQETCIKHLIGCLELHPIVLVFDFAEDGFIEIYEEEIVNRFWLSFLRLYKQYVEKKGSNVIHSIYCFVINYNKSIPFLTPADNDNATCVVNLFPVSLLEEDDWDEWNDEIHYHLKELTYSPELQYRKQAMIKICNDNGIKMHIIDSKVLVYD